MKSREELYSLLSKELTAWQLQGTDTSLPRNWYSGGYDYKQWFERYNRLFLPVGEFWVGMTNDNPNTRVRQARRSVVNVGDRMEPWVAPRYRPDVILANALLDGKWRGRTSRAKYGYYCTASLRKDYIEAHKGHPFAHRRSREHLAAAVLAPFIDRELGLY